MSRNYIVSDYELMIDICKSEINFLKSSWQNMLGRPLVTIACRNVHLGICIVFDSRVGFMYRLLQCFIFHHFNGAVQLEKAQNHRIRQ